MLVKRGGLLKSFILNSWYFSFKILILVSWFSFANKKKIWEYLDSFSIRDLNCQKSWFLTRNGKSQKIILDSCLIPKLRIWISRFLSRPFKCYLALLWTQRRTKGFMCHNIQGGQNDGDVCQVKGHGDGSIFRQKLIFILYIATKILQIVHTNLWLAYK